MSYPIGSDIEIRRADIGGEEAVRLITVLNAELSRQYPEEGATHFRLDPDEVIEGRGAFFIAYEGERAIGCGAVRLINSETAEVKRMFVIPDARGRGISKQILLGLEAEGRRLGARKLVLETGERQIQAMTLYIRAGFSHIPAFGEYVDSPLSVCMGKEL